VPSPYETWRRLLRHEPLPAAVVDLDAVARNAAVLGQQLRLGAAGRSPAPTLRIATKSVRSPGLLRRLLDLDPAFQGLLCTTAAEARALAEQGFDDLFVAYPAARRDEVRTLAELTARGLRVVATVDCVEHIDLLDAAGRELGVVLRLAIDLDMSLRPAGGRLGHLGVRRSPVRDVAAARSLAAHAAGAPGVQLVGLLGYEAQVAGIADENPTSRGLDPVRALIKERSRAAVRALRGAVGQALRQDGHHLDLVNGGGTGSLAFTAGDPSVTEVAAGSGFLCPHLFDHYRDLDLEPAAFFVLAVVRRSDPAHLTCFGGGYIASGPAGPDRVPRVYLPEGLSPLGFEGWGEVQTPFRDRSRERLELGDPVLCRHAKAGELAERFAELVLVQDGAIVERVPTWRGLGLAFG